MNEKVRYFMCAKVLGRRVLVAFLIYLLVMSIFVVVILQEQRPELKFIGSLYANDSGKPVIESRWMGEYNLSIFDHTMKLKLITGFEDPLRKHTYRVIVKEFVEKSYIWLYIENGSQPGAWLLIRFQYFERDPVWGLYNGYYIAHYVNPTIFPGFGNQYYVEIRIKPVT